MEDIIFLFLKVFDATPNPGIKVNLITLGHGKLMITFPKDVP